MGDNRNLIEQQELKMQSQTEGQEMGCEQGGSQNHPPNSPWPACQKG